MMSCQVIMRLPDKYVEGTAASVCPMDIDDTEDITKPTLLNNTINSIIIANTSSVVIPSANAMAASLDNYQVGVLFYF